MYIRNFIFVCIIILQIPFEGITQSDSYNFAKLSTYNGLSHNQINTILRDTDGFMWFGTMSGLNRYDGYTFKTFYKKNNDTHSLTDNYILKLFELPDKKMWVSTNSYIPCIYDANTERFDADWQHYLTTLGLPSGWIINIIKGHDKRYWFLFNTDLYLYEGINKTRLFKHKPNAAWRIAFLEETLDKKLWLIYANGFLQQYDIQTDKIIFSSDALQQIGNEDSNYQFIIDTEQNLWIWSFLHGVYLFHPSNQSITHIHESSNIVRLTTNKVTHVVEDNRGVIWVATDQGGITLIHKNNKFKTSYLFNNPKDAKSISQNVIYSMYKDSYGILWIGTHKQGVNYLNNNIIQFERYTNHNANGNSLQYDDVNDFAEDKWGNLWIATNGGGLIYFDRKKNTFKQYLHKPNDKNSLSNNVVVSLCIDHEGMLWIGSYFGGLSKFDGRQFTHYKHQHNNPHSLVNDNVWKIYEDAQNRLWIGTLGGGLDRFERATNQFHHVKQIISNYISTIIQDKDGDIWVGAENGITILKKTGEVLAFQHTNEPGSLSHANVTCLLKDTHNNIWVGTRDGLNLFREKSKDFLTFSTADGLPDNLILNILEDNYGTFWLDTPNGVCNLIPSKQSGTFSFTVRNYDENNNLQSINFNDHAALKTKAGALVFGGPFGFNIINPQTIKQVNVRPKVSFTNLQILNENIEPGESFNDRVVLEKSLPNLQQIDLKYSENVFSIEFTSLDFLHSPHVKYAYILEGFNTDWLYVQNQRRATYTNLAPGSYVLKVKVLGDNQQQWSVPKSLQINIAPPFWRSTIAYMMYGVLFLIAFYFIRRITLERIHMRFEVEQQRKEAERMQALEQFKTKLFTNVSHEFRTPLSLIIAPLDKILKQTLDEDLKKQLSLMQRNANRLLKLVNQLLDFRKMESDEIRLHPSIGDIISFCKDITILFSDIAEKKNIQLSFSSNIESLEIYFDKDKIEKILFNLLSNAFKYTYNNGCISVTLTYNLLDAPTLSIEVQDTGIGIAEDKQEKIFEHFFQTDVPDNMVNQGTGLGLAITKEFVKLHQGTITVKSQPEQGSCFTVTLPTTKIHDISLSEKTDLIEYPTKESVENETFIDKKTKKKTIMLVEDSDELRFYLKDNLKEKYTIVEASNGKDGWEKIKKIVPDIVVTDLMMPAMTGIEMAKKIKNDTSTAHIPVILLTAMGSEQQQIEGFNIGINDYILKPFTFEILASRINNLLNQQAFLQKKFQKQIVINPEEVTITSIDEKFMNQALKVVEKNISNADFSVEDLSAEMNMNRVTLYRKILSLTGKTPLEFIRLIRLKKAALLLEKSGMSIAEIAYEVGFNNPKNFTNFFKEEFQTLPSKYRDEKRF